MSALPLFFDQIRRQVITWAQAHDDIRAVVLTGSAARHNHPADAYSDLDIEIWTTNPHKHYDNHEWIVSFGVIWHMFSVPTGEDDLQWLVLYEGGYKVDYSLLPVRSLQELVDNADLFGSMLRGYEIWVDKDGLAAQLRPSYRDEPPPYRPPSAAEFDALFGEFFYGVVYVAKQVKRRNLWKIKWADVYQQKSLLQMLEWHAHATSTEPVDTWNDGNFMQEWVNDETWEAVHGVFARFDAGDSQRALLASIALFRRLAQETAQKLGFTYKTGLDNEISAYVDNLLRD